MSLFDIFDENDSPTHTTASYDQVHDDGLWHRGVHVIIYTPDGEIVMQKRSVSLKYHPGEIEISVGGGVDAGETPLQAIVREIVEELGIVVNPSSLKFIGKHKFNHRTKTQINRVHIYSYSICIDREKLHLTPRNGEVDNVFLISKNKLKRALRVHRIKKFGKISSLYAYWRTLLNSTEQSKDELR